MSSTEQMPQDSWPASIEESQLSESGVLIRRYRQGDTAALNELLQHYYPLVKRIVRARLGKRLGQYYDDDDFIQDTFLQAIRAIEGAEIRDSASFRGWLAAITERQILGAHRYHTSAKNDWDRELNPNADKSTDGMVEIGSDREPSPSRPAKEDEYQDLIDQCMAELPEDEREVILMRHYMEHSWKEITAKLNRPSVDAARQLRDRALQRLNEIVRRRSTDLPTGFTNI